jgi:hypothetical protein
VSRFGKRGSLMDLITETFRGATEPQPVPLNSGPDMYQFVMSTGSSSDASGGRDRATAKRRPLASRVVLVGTIGCRDLVRMPLCACQLGLCVSCNLYRVLFKRLRRCGLGCRLPNQPAGVCLANGPAPRCRPVVRSSLPLQRGSCLAAGSRPFDGNRRQALEKLRAAHPVRPRQAVIGSAVAGVFNRATSSVGPSRMPLCATHVVAAEVIAGGRRKVFGIVVGSLCRRGGRGRSSACAAVITESRDFCGK